MSGTESESAPNSSPVTGTRPSAAAHTRKANTASAPKAIGSHSGVRR